MTGGLLSEVIVVILTDCSLLLVAAYCCYVVTQRYIEVQLRLNCPDNTNLHHERRKTCRSGFPTERTSRVKMLTMALVALLMVIGTHKPTSTHTHARADAHA